MDNFDKNITFALKIKVLMKARVTFSVTIPAYKSQYLKEAIESVVGQTCQDWELIVVDDCSPEDLAAIVNPYLTDSRIRYYRNDKNCGAEHLVDNWNISLGYCTGDYVICMGDDDCLLPDCLKVISELIEMHPGLQVYHAQTEIIDENGVVTEQQEPRPAYEDALAMMNRKWNGGKQFIGDLCFSRTHLLSTGGYYPLPYAWGSDDITAFRAALFGGIANTATTAFQYRENRYSISQSHNEKEKVDAVIQLRAWYQQQLSELITQGKYSESDIHTSEEALERFTKGLIGHHILCDMQHGGFTRYLFWNRSRHKHGITSYQLLKMYIKSLLP